MKKTQHCWGMNILIACRISSYCWCDTCELLTLIIKALEAQVFSPQLPFINSICTDSLLEMSKQMKRFLWNLLFGSASALHELACIFVAAWPIYATACVPQIYVSSELQSCLEV